MQNITPLAQRTNKQVLIDSLGTDATGFFLRQLTEIEQRMYEVLYQPLKGMELFPIDGSANPGAEMVMFNVMDKVGKAKISPHAPINDAPRSDILLQQLGIKIASVTTSFGYSIQELRAASMAGMALDTAKSDAARRTMETSINDLIWTGFETAEIYGVLNTPSVPVSTVPDDGTGASTHFKDKTPDKILRDMNSCINEIFVNSGGTHRATHLILPVEQYQYVNSTPYATNYSGDTILAVFRRNNPDLTIDFANELKDAGPTGDDVMIAYEYNPVNFNIVLPVAFESFPPIRDGLEFLIYCHARCGGALVRYPLSINIKEGI